MGRYKVPAIFNHLFDSHGVDKAPASLIRNIAQASKKESLLWDHPGHDFIALFCVQEVAEIVRCPYHIFGQYVTAVVSCLCKLGV